MFKIFKINVKSLFGWPTSPEIKTNILNVNKIVKNTYK